MKLCIFSNDPIISYFDKGELKERYFNPKNIFNEIHIISPIVQDIEESKVQKMVGEAKLVIHPIGQPTIFNAKSKLPNLKKIITEVNPDIIRVYNPLMQGWLATKISLDMKIPIILSLHNNYEDMRKIHLKTHNYIKFLKLWYTKQFIESFVISHASKIICSYRFLELYAKKMGAKNVEVIYNRVNLSKFSPNIKPKYTFNEFTIIYVARLDQEKNHECLIKAIKDLNVKLILIGNGPLKEKLQNLIHELKISKKIIFIESVPNEELGQYYCSADLFAAPIRQGGVSIPMLEAMASGLPLIVTERISDYHEDIDEAVLLVKNTPEEFKKAILKMRDEKQYRDTMKQKVLSVVKELDGSKMEEKESKLYLDLLKHSRGEK